MEDAQRRLDAGDPAGACEVLRRAATGDPGNPTAWINLAAALRAIGRADEEMEALERALAIEPRHVRALLQKASLLELRNRHREAAMTYRNALQVIPPGTEFPPQFRPILEHARDVVQANNRALESFLQRRLGEDRERHAHERLERFDHCLDIVLQKERIYRQQPTFLFFPGLPSIPFYDRADFPWLDRLEAASEEIRAEFLEVLSGDEARFEPYVAFREGVPVDQWRELNHSRRWSVCYLWREGVPEPRHMKRCPRTLAALEGWPRWDAKGPTVVFSVLDAKTRIPPHTGVYNTRLTIHLPLVIPPGCGLRVGAERRGWEFGKAMVFDDSIEHEAWNESDVPRAVLIVDTWNPLISAAERDLVRDLVAGVEAYYSAS